MTSVGISVEEAVQEFDLLYDEFFEITQPRPVASARSLRANKMSSNSGEDKLESAGSAGQEIDEVCTDSATDPEQQENIRQVARALAKVGDKLFEDCNSTNLKLISLFTQTSGLEYETFKNTLESLVEQCDPNATNFVFLMCLSDKVVGSVGHYASKAKSFFRRYISNGYKTTLAGAGGVKLFVGQQT